MTCGKGRLKVLRNLKPGLCFAVFVLEAVLAARSIRFLRAENEPAKYARARAHEMRRTRTRIEIADSSQSIVAQCRWHSPFTEVARARFPKGLSMGTDGNGIFSKPMLSCYNFFFSFFSVGLLEVAGFHRHAVSFRRHHK